jgi:hypothetical protein
MPKKTPETKKLILFLALLAILSGAVYINFLRYTPKKLREVNEVKGFKSQEEFVLPYPRYSKKIGETETSESRQVTIETEKTPQEIHNFYKNILLDKGWEVESEGLHDDFQVSKFKNEDKLITVVSSRQKDSGTSIASIEISNR